MLIEFAGEAGDSYRTAVSMLTGWTVRVTTADDTFDARLVGPDTDADLYNTLRVQRIGADDQPRERVDSVEAEKLYVY